MYIELLENLLKKLYHEGICKEDSMTNFKLVKNYSNDNLDEKYDL